MVIINGNHKRVFSKTYNNKHFYNDDLKKNNNNNLALVGLQMNWNNLKSDTHFVFWYWTGFIGHWAGFWLVFATSDLSLNLRMSLLEAERYGYPFFITQNIINTVSLNWIFRKKKHLPPVTSSCNKFHSKKPWILWFQCHGNSDGRISLISKSGWSYQFSHVLICDFT